jgi:hypothetical protein
MGSRSCRRSQFVRRPPTGHFTEATTAAAAMLNYRAIISKLAPPPPPPYLGEGHVRSRASRAYSPGSAFDGWRLGLAVSLAIVDTPLDRTIRFPGVRARTRERNRDVQAAGQEVPIHLFRCSRGDHGPAIHRRIGARLQRWWPVSIERNLGTSTSSVSCQGFDFGRGLSTLPRTCPPKRFAVTALPASVNWERDLNPHHGPEPSRHRLGPHAATDRAGRAPIAPWFAKEHSCHPGCA